MDAAAQCGVRGDIESFLYDARRLLCVLRARVWGCLQVSEQPDATRAVPRGPPQLERFRRLHLVRPRVSVELFSALCLLLPISAAVRRCREYFGGGCNRIWCDSVARISQSQRRHPAVSRTPCLSRVVWMARASSAAHRV